MLRRFLVYSLPNCPASDRQELGAGIDDDLVEPTQVDYEIFRGGRAGGGMAATPDGYLKVVCSRKANLANVDEPR